jgi:hypothetical protein
LKEGAEMTQRHALPSYGVQLERAGCIDTTIDWDRVTEVLKRYDGRKAGRKVKKGKAKKGKTKKGKTKKGETKK